MIASLVYFVNMAWNPFVDKTKFGEEMRVARCKAGISQSNLSRLVHCAATYLSHIERGARAPKVDLAKRIAMVLGLDVDLALSWLGTVDVDVIDFLACHPEVTLKVRRMMKEAYIAEGK